MVSRMPLIRSCDDYGRKNADDLADATHLAPVDLVEGFVHLPQNFASSVKEAVSSSLGDED